MSAPRLDIYEERVVRELLESAIRRRQKTITEQHGMGVANEKSEIVALRKAIEVLGAQP